MGRQEARTGTYGMMTRRTSDNHTSCPRGSGNRNWPRDEGDGGRVPDVSPAEICRSGRGYRVRARVIGSCSCPKSAELGLRDRLAIPAAELQACNPCG
jgi:hypothetical protein